MCGSWFSFYMGDFLEAPGVIACLCQNGLCYFGPLCVIWIVDTSFTFSCEGQGLEKVVVVVALKLDVGSKCCPSSPSTVLPHALITAAAENSYLYSALHSHNQTVLCLPKVHLVIQRSKKVPDEVVCFHMFLPDGWNDTMEGEEKRKKLNSYSIW